MTSPAIHPVTNETTWAEANQALLVAEFARLKHRFAQGDRPIPFSSARTEALPRHSTPAAIDQLVDIFDLTPFERDILLLCSGIEMDSELAELFGPASSRTPITFGLALGSLSDPHWSALTPARPLRRFQLVQFVQMEQTRSLTTSPIRIDERILHFVAGTNLLDQRLGGINGIVRPPTEPVLLASEHRTQAECALAALKEDHTRAIHLCGNDPLGHQDVAQIVAAELDLRLLCLSAEELPAAQADLDQTMLLLERETILLPAAILLQLEESGLTPSARRLAEKLPGPVFLSSRESLQLNRPFLRLDLDKPGPAEQRRLWHQALGVKFGDESDKEKTTSDPVIAEVDNISDQFSLSASTIFTTSATVSSRPSPEPHQLWDACRSVARPKLDDLAQRIVPSSSWRDLILPEQQTDTLHKLVAQVRHRMTVHEEWGFAARGRRGLGVSALFAGESGTGKTLAAEVLAAELRLDLYRIDLSSVVSKFIGETEKNLRQVFDAAEDGGILLLFDEADALFGKRAEVKDSHDRYANIEVGYLLQRMEAYQGLAVLTTNLKSSLDRAFQRRLRFIVHFPFPDAAQREEIWKHIFPTNTPLNNLDYAKLAQLNVAGGNIRNIALSAAFLAAEERKSVGMSHLLAAAQMEAHKIERPLATAEIRGWE